MLKKLISYFYPITIHRVNSTINKRLEVTLVNGSLVLDSPNTNYSYGSLQRVLRKGLLHIGFDTIRSMQEILILGVAGGSVIKTLVDEIGCRAKITGIEIDEEAIRLATDYFQLDQIKSLNIIHHEAFEFVLKTKRTYDLIIIDVFQDTLMPGFLFEPFFQDRLNRLLNSKGHLLFNTMLLNAKDQIRNQNYLRFYDSLPFSAVALPRIETHNELLVVTKLD